MLIDFSFIESGSHRFSRNSTNIYLLPYIKLQMGGGKFQLISGKPLLSDPPQPPICILCQCTAPLSAVVNNANANKVVSFLKLFAQQVMYTKREGYKCFRDEFREDQLTASKVEKLLIFQV